MPDPLLVSLLLALLVLGSSLLAIELGISVAIAELLLGIAGGNALGLATTPYVDYLASFGSIVLTFLAGIEIDTALFREKFKESVTIGFLSFLGPMLGCAAFAYFIAHWSATASLLAGVALSTTSMAVVYAVMVETGLTDTRTGKVILAATFVTDISTVVALSLIFAAPNWFMAIFAVIVLGIIVVLPRVTRVFFGRYGKRLSEPEVKFVFALLFFLAFIADKANIHAVVAAFIIGVVMSKEFLKAREVRDKIRTVAFAFLTPLFFLKAGFNVSVAAVVANFALMLAFLAAKVASKFAMVYPPAKAWMPKEATYTTLLMSTGLTFGSIASLYGLENGLVDRTQFSILITVVILSAIVPTLVAQKWFQPPVPRKANAEIEPKVVPEVHAGAEQGVEADVS